MSRLQLIVSGISVVLIVISVATLLSRGGVVSAVQTPGVAEYDPPTPDEWRRAVPIEPTSAASEESRAALSSFLESKIRLDPDERPGLLTETTRAALLTTLGSMLELRAEPDASSFAAGLAESAGERWIVPDDAAWDRIDRYTRHLAGVTLARDRPEAALGEFLSLPGGFGPEHAIVLLSDDPGDAVIGVYRVSTDEDVDAGLIRMLQGLGRDPILGAGAGQPALRFRAPDRSFEEVLRKGPALFAVVYLTAATMQGERVVLSLEMYFDPDDLMWRFRSIGRYAQRGSGFVLQQ